MQRPRRLLILAEGRSGDPHFGKTGRGVIRYRPDDVVAVLDSTRAGEADDGLPVVASVRDALAFEPTTALVGVATPTSAVVGSNGSASRTDAMTGRPSSA